MLPTRPHPDHVALYRFFAATGGLLYIGICDEPVKRWYAHADKPWWPEVCTFRVVWFPSREEAASAEAAAILEERPEYNIVFNGVPYNSSRFPGAHLYALARERFGDRAFSLHDLVDELGVPYGSAVGHARRLQGEGLFEEIGTLKAGSGRARVHFRALAHPVG
jgi:hypothetical protein